MVLLMFFEALYFAHFLSFYTMQLEPPKFVGARAVGPWVGEQKPLGKSPLRGNPSPESTYLPEVEGAMRGGVEGLAGVEGENVVGPSPLELPLRHEQCGACVGPREGPLLAVADHSVPCKHFRDALGEGAREQLHVQLA